ncbi:MAG: SIS domain-containing protein [Gammaproteobacteria bacterium]|nr:SIS domain-containing protein [Gammaproteobacteria bacterium]MBT3861056.1 SIS domain-containing protein [Gammaproteobacteria bacterium]MBT3987734.1 SIS domain-containing protein [Gammaproteobacteria bacterium]MBT4582686.1 SIS domain-containing protein [Gammaproteobacteria bacterium]MBT4657986.1 SIS domain-containing protein [Gammaproteobacteria bacterium]
MDSPNLIRRITENKSVLRKSEAKVANFVLEHANDVINMRIVDLAESSDVSEPTVIRFCRALGFDGFQSFKLQLAQQLGLGGVYTQFAVDDKDTVKDLSNKVFNTTVGSLLAVRDELDPVVVETAINTIRKANRVEFYGFGASGSVAADAQHKFFRLQLSAAAYTDPHIQHMSAISLGSEDVVVAISQSGRTKALLESVRLARDAGATVIGLAPQNTPLSEQCSIPIYVNMEEEHQAYAPVSSRIAHLVVIDVLATGVALHRKPLLKDHLKRLQKSQKALRNMDQD